MVVYGTYGEDGKALVYPLLERILAEHFSITPLPEMRRHQRGKPFFPQHPELHFNLSHSGGLAICGVGTSPLGVDVEVIRPRRQTLPQFTLSPEEFQWFEDRGATWGDFYSLWVLKESYIKCLGTGLNLPPREIAVPLLDVGAVAEFQSHTFHLYGSETWRCAICTLGTQEIKIELQCP